jgi:curli biogenesis system outer membrane secretion channel CsgG
VAATRILDITFPARIVSLDPLIISRGSNDGVKEGEIYQVEREGKELKDANGLIIARLKSEVGQVEVVAPQETISIVKPVSGGSFKTGDRASLDRQPSESQPTRSSVPLKARTATPAPQPQLPRVAVGLIKSSSTAKTGKDAQKHTPIFTDSIISRLAQTRRFQMIDRQETDQLLKELEAQAMAGNRDMASPMGTLNGADYLVYGSLASFGVEDKTLKLPGSSRLFKHKIGHAEGNMRIVDTRSGDILESRKITVSRKVNLRTKGSRTVVAMADAFAEQVALMLMNSIYPIKVAHVGSDGTA